MFQPGPIPKPRRCARCRSVRVWPAGFAAREAQAGALLPISVPRSISGAPSIQEARGCRYFIQSHMGRDCGHYGKALKRPKLRGSASSSYMKRVPFASFYLRRRGGPAVLSVVLPFNSREMQGHSSAVRVYLLTERRAGSQQGGGWCQCRHTRRKVAR